jgi:serine/threonine protein kinase
MSPEQARGEENLGPQSDQFSLGLVLYELAVHRPAFKRQSAAETMTAIIREDPRAASGSHPRAAAVGHRSMLAKVPADRYDSTRDLYRELKQIRDRLSDATSVAGPAAARLPRRWPGARSAASLATAALVGVLLGGIAIAMWMASKDGTPSTANSPHP